MHVCVSKYVITIVVFLGLVLIWDSCPVDYTFNLIPFLHIYVYILKFSNFYSIFSCTKGCKVDKVILNVTRLHHVNSRLESL